MSTERMVSEVQLHRVQKELAALTQENQRLLESRESLLRTAQTECSRIAAERDGAQAQLTGALREIERLRDTLMLARSLIQDRPGDFTEEEGRYRTSFVLDRINRVLADAALAGKESPATNAPTPAKPC